MNPAAAFRSYGLTDIGLVRQRNEDAFLDRPDLGVWAVADGMGGHEAGDVASTAIVAALAAMEPVPTLEEAAAIVQAAMAMVDRALRTKAASLGPGAVVASTAVILLVRGSRAAVLWAGDSRAYRCRGGDLSQLSVDHSQVQTLVDAGLLSPDTARFHPASNIVTRAIGTGPVVLDSVHDDIQPGDRYLLCSDGLTNMLSDDEIAAELTGAPDAVAERLRRLVLARGAIDNVTIVIADATVG